MPDGPPTRCFVMMPSGLGGEYPRDVSEANFVFSNIISPAVYKALEEKGHNILLHREVDNNLPGAITTNIVRHIVESDVVIVDITGRNANVFFELGMRFALRKNITILMHQEKTTIPFDIRNYRSIEYNPFLVAEAVEKLRQVIVEARGSSRENIDSLVFEIFPSLEVNFNVEPHAPMPWPFYWRKFRAIEDHLSEAFREKRYIPDAIVGVTNGGAMFGDLIAHRVRYGCPCVSLWANRDRKGLFFDNEVNRSMLAGLRKNIKKRTRDLRILLVDDIVASGATLWQAVDVIKGVLRNCHLRFLPLFYKEDRNYMVVENIIIWKHHAFQFDHETINQLHLVHWDKFPYEKTIRST